MRRVSAAPADFDWQEHRECRAKPLARTVRADRPSVQFDQCPRDVKPQPQSLPLGYSDGISPAKTLEDKGKKIRIDAGAIVGYRHP